MGFKSSKYPRQLFAFRHWITIMLLFSNAFQKKMRVRVKSGDWVFGSCSLLPKYGCYIHLLCYSVSWKTGWLHFLVPVKYMMYFWPLVVTLRMYLVQPVVLFFVPNCYLKLYIHITFPIIRRAIRIAYYIPLLFIATIDTFEAYLFLCPM